VRTLVAYVSGHGFGHASRTIELLNTLATRAPEIRLELRSPVAPWLVARTARAALSHVTVECDTGAVQRDSLHVDPEATIRRAEAFMATWDERVAVEAAALKAAHAALVVADAPPLGIAAACAAGVPAVLLGNFTWDWIYADYPGGSAVAETIGRVYAHADLALRLPLHGGFATCPRVRDVPFIARRSHRGRDEVRRALGLPLDRPLALVSFGGYGVEGLDLAALAATPGIGIVMSGATLVGGETLQARGPTGALLPVDEAALYDRGFRYEDLVRAVDVVVSKPGYGIIAECAANGTALLYTSRGRFAEYGVLVAGMPRILRTAFVDRTTLLAGRWAPAVRALLDQPPPPERADVSGAEVAAALLLDMM
jgi:L-arabinokinase